MSLAIDCDRSWYGAIRALERRPTLHPHSKHVTQAGPARHDLIGNGVGLLHVGMRKYGPVRIEVFKDPRPKSWWHWKHERALCRYRRDKYARDLQNALIEAWRC